MDTSKLRKGWTVGQHVEFQTDHGGFAVGYVIEYEPEHDIVTVRDDDENVWSGHEERVRLLVNGVD